MKIAPQIAGAKQAGHSSLDTGHSALGPGHSSVGTGHSVKVHIEELVLHGFAPGDRRKIAHAVETELARLLTEGAAPRWAQNTAAIGRINAGAFQVVSGAKPQAAGVQIAQAVYRSLRRSSAQSRMQAMRNSLAGKAPFGVR